MFGFYSHIHDAAKKMGMTEDALRKRILRGEVRVVPDLDVPKVSPQEMERKKNELFDTPVSWSLDEIPDTNTRALRYQRIIRVAEKDILVRMYEADPNSACRNIVVIGDLNYTSLGLEEHEVDERAEDILTAIQETAEKGGVFDEDFTVDDLNIQRSVYDVCWIAINSESVPYERVLVGRKADVMAGGTGQVMPERFSSCVISLDELDSRIGGKLTTWPGGDRLAQTGALSEHEKDQLHEEVNNKKPVARWEVDPLNLSSMEDDFAVLRKYMADAEEHTVEDENLDEYLSVVVSHLLIRQARAELSDEQREDYTWRTDHGVQLWRPHSGNADGVFGEDITERIVARLEKDYPQPYSDDLMREDNRQEIRKDQKGGRNGRRAPSRHKADMIHLASLLHEVDQWSDAHDPQLEQSIRNLLSHMHLYLLEPVWIPLDYTIQRVRIEDADDMTTSAMDDALPYTGTLRGNDETVRQQRFLRAHLPDEEGWSVPLVGSYGAAFVLNADETEAIIVQ